VISYRQTQLAKLRNVEHIPSRRLTVADVLEYGADYVVIATGAHWHPQGLQGITFDVIDGADAAAPHVLTPEQIVVDHKPVGNDVVVYDVDGYYTAASVAELLGQGNKRVTYVTPLAQFAPYMAFTLEEQRQREALHRLGVEIIAGQIMTKVTPESV